MRVLQRVRDLGHDIYDVHERAATKLSQITALQVLRRKEDPRLGFVEFMDSDDAFVDQVFSPPGTPA